jgi:hypothetical protein
MGIADPELDVAVAAMVAVSALRRLDGARLRDDQPLEETHLIGCVSSRSLSGSLKRVGRTSPE